MFLSLYGAGLWLLVGSVSATELSADDAVRSGLQYDPIYLSILAEAEIARGELRAATTLRANPILAGDASLTSDRWGASLQQPLSLTGQGLAARAAASEGVSAAELACQRAALVSAAEARMAWADAVAAEAQAQLAAQALEQATDRRQAMEARHNAGDAAPLDVHLARLAEIQAAADRIAAQNTAAQARVALARFVPDAATVALPRDPRAAAPAPSQGTTRADVDAAEHRVEAAQAEQRAARAAGLPVVSLGAFVEQEGGELAVGPAAELTLPLWKVNPEGRAQANAAVQVASADAAALRATANTELLTMTAALTIASEVEVRLSTDASADAIAALAAVEEAHQRGELSVVTATLLRQEIVVAWSAAIELEREVARARISALLATSDPALLPLDLREESR